MRLSLLQGKGSRRVVCICFDDCLLGQPRVSDHVPCPCYGEVPRHSLAHDWVWVLRSLDVLLFFSSTGSCSRGTFFLKCWSIAAVLTVTLFTGQLQCTPRCSFFLRVLWNVRVRSGRRAQVPGLEGGPAGPGRAEGDADCHELAPLRRRQSQMEQTAMYFMINFLEVKSLCIRRTKKYYVIKLVFLYHHFNKLNSPLKCFIFIVFM